MKKFIFFVLSCVISGNLSAQTALFENAEKYTSDQLQKVMRSSRSSYNWIGESSLFYYTDSTGEIPACYIVDAERKTKKLLYQTQELVQKLKELTAKDIDSKDFYLYSLDIDPKNIHEFKFNFKTKRYVYYTKTARLEEVKKPIVVKTGGKTKSFSFGKQEYWKKFSPDSNWFVYGYRHNVYLQKADEATSTQLTSDGAPYYSFTSSNASSTDDKKSSTMLYWLKDSKKLISLREDKRKVQEMTIINSLTQPRPKVETYKFPMPGDKEVVKYELFLFDVDKRNATKVDIEKYRDQKIIMQNTITSGRTLLQANNIGANGPNVYFLRRSRTNDQIDLCALNTETGKVKVVISETCEPHFNDQLFSCHIINEGKDILWWSERSGFGQYYLYDAQGKLKSTLTKDNLVAGLIHEIDTAGRKIIFEGYGREKNVNPYYRMYYQVNLDGSDFRLLTPGDGYHDLELAKNGKYLIDTYSRMDQPAITVLRDRKGKQILELAKDDISGLISMGWKKPEILKMKAADGITDLYGIIYKPFNLDSTKKYPIITNVYPGPQEDFIPRKFTIDDNYNQSLAQLGFIVINFGYRGSSPVRGKAFHTYGYANLRDYALADDQHIIKQLAAKHSYIDLNKVGIYGHSGGGFMSATALLSAPDFYKVAVSASGNYDTNIYTQWWGETYHGVWLKDGIFKSDIPTTAALASNLKGKLFLITGDVDKNVHPANTFRLADALIKQNKRFDMMVLPGKDHGLGDKYYINLIRYYFIENLLGITSKDVDIVTHK